MIKILLVDDHGIVRDGIKATLSSEKNIKIIGEASNGIEAIEQVKKLTPDVVIMDISMPEMNGIEATAIISDRYPNTKTLVLSMHDNEDYILKSIESGAYGYLLKDTGKEEFIKAITTISKGDKYFSTPVSSIIAEGYLQKIKKGSAPDDDSDDFGLTKREKGILKMIINGNSNREIADSFTISIRTIETHRFNIMKKLKVKNAAELVKLALENKIV
ncbi:MAG: response regulator transcription factor [Sporocytophaga sp.]|uniref:response regulator n=1 Tax=Sporocytophaga sp. TaxID=2231183 RepID=UPI001B03610D|nr:response regulator transcription factor [Sporocytophaga sp.]MBO9699333.1 response regulator transcription factor [Sporocytophaga sp.]